LTVIALATIPTIGVAQLVDSMSAKSVIMPPDSTILRTFGGLVLSTDSLQRWQQWSGFGEWASRQPRFISRDLGGYGRNAGISTSPYSINSDRIRWNGVIINNPLTTQFNPSEIPFEQSSEVVHHDTGLSEFGVYPQIYSVLKPLTVIQYEQSSYEYRNLDGVLAMPATDKLTIQASFQGQKDDGKFARSNFAGRRSTGNIRYDMDGKWTTDAFWLYQGAEMQESMGYRFNDPSEFSFDRFRAQARSSNTASMRRFFLFGVKMSPDGAAQDRGITLYRKLHRHEWRTTDTTAIRAQEWGFNAIYALSIGSQARLMPYVDASLVSNNLGDVESPSRSADMMYNLGIRGEYNAGKLVDLILHAETSSSLAGAGRLMDVAGRFHLPFNTGVMVGYSLVSAPQPISLDFASNFDYLLNELPSKMDGTTLYANILRSTGTLRYRFDYRYTNSGSIPAVRSDKQIISLNLEESAMISGSLEHHTDHTEAMIGFNSITWGFTNGALGPSSEQRLISSAFWKGYVFKRAAYLKGGAVFSATLSESRSMAYQPELGIWLFSADGAAVPAHHRLDLEFAARVRSMILTGRLENTLDGWTQKGYFQTLPHPMPGRRFRVGLKVHFRD
jgi:hypothetical protein